MNLFSSPNSPLIEDSQITDDFDPFPPMIFLEGDLPSGSSIDSQMADQVARELLESPRILEEQLADTDLAPLDIATLDLHLTWLKHGDRASQFLSLYPSFQSFHGTNGIVRYQIIRGAWIAATEPLAAVTDRVKLANEFLSEAKIQGVSRVIFLPVSGEFASALQREGWAATRVGSEARFLLHEHPTGEILSRLGSARAWGRKGAVVESFDTSPRNMSSPDGLALQQALENWKQSRRGPSLGFLNQVSPWLYSEQKRIWILRYAQQIQAFVVAVPIPAREGYFFSEYIRMPSARAGMLEFLFLEVFALLRAEGAKEVSLGLSPLAVRNAPAWQRFWYERISLPFSFRSLREFKAKFGPSHWDEQYLVSSKPIGWRTWHAVAAVHLPGGVLRSLAATVGEWMRESFLQTLKPQWRATMRWRVPRPTFALVSVALVLHGLKESLPQMRALFDASGFVAGREGLLPWIQGWLLGPLLHNHAFHLLGDLASLLIFGAVAEAVGGIAFWGVVVAAGLWASNPVTVGLLKLSLWGSSDSLTRLMAEVDYGTSNAVYSLVGALAMTMRDPRWLLLPFALNGLFICYANQSLLALHHLVALGLGMSLALVFERVKRARE